MLQHWPLLLQASHPAAFNSHVPGSFVHDYAELRLKLVESLLRITSCPCGYEHSTMSLSFFTLTVWLPS